MTEELDKIILIGGAPTAGKSYLARRLAEELKLPWISTDTIRGQMRKLVNKLDYPALFHHEDAGADIAEEFLNNNTAQEIVEFQNNESKDVWIGVAALMESDYVWGSFIIEGVAVLPELVANTSIVDKIIKPVFIIDQDVNRIKNIIYTRGLWDDADKYPDSVKDTEIEWVLEFNKYIQAECQKYNFPIVYVGDRISYIDQVKSLVK